LFDSLTCAENLHFPLRELTPLNERDRKRQVTQALADVGLVGQEELQIPEMSGGMQKRLGIARALVLSPEVILYDDPTAGLDPITSRSILSLIHRMRKKYEMTLIIVTSDPSQAYQICDRVGFLWHGHFVETGTPDEMKASKHPAVRQFLHGLLEGPLS
jgi:phospholipid/cholesterol/gamma-HCH transport system ATP-binding protein